MQGIIIAGTHSGCGKTTVTLGLLAAFRRKGLEVQSFKAGPDFIDSGIHRLITGKPSRNLDAWMCGQGPVKDCFQRHAADADIAVVEGVMGMYDGNFSTADLALLVNLPVMLVVDAYGMAESAGALVRGFAGHRNSGLVSGVIFNRVASGSHFERLKRSIRDCPVFGYLPRDLRFEIPHRHLGLLVAEEDPITGENIERLADAVLDHIDIDGILRQWARGNKQGGDTMNCAPPHPSPVASIAVAYDKAFCFYYEDNLDLLEDAGAEIVRFSPLSDPRIPDGADAVYLGGGYPELYAEALSRNTSMLESVYAWADSGRPLYAECGGLMYLSKGIHDFNGNFFKMSGVFPFEALMRKGRSRLGYREVTLKGDSIIGKKGDICRGHEFHYSDIDTGAEELGNGSPASRASGLELIYSVKNGAAQAIQDEGYRWKSTLASYIHIHFGSNPRIAQDFINFIKER